MPNLSGFHNAAGQQVDRHGGTKQDIDGRMIVDGALAGVGEVVEQLAVGGDHGGWTC